MKLDHFSEVSHPSSSSIAGDYLCWSRMQSEAGQELEQIIKRKELEREANGGVFCWGVGNAPSVEIRRLARMRTPVPVIFSRMKTKPKAVDSSPTSILVWRRYIDFDGRERPLPDYSLVTSRGHSGSGNPKTKHFALICSSESPLRLEGRSPFYHRNFRNAGVNGGPIGSSQVTALLKRGDQHVYDTEYEINLRAWLTDSYWVRLTDPVILRQPQRELYGRSSSLCTKEWAAFVRSVRESSDERLTCSDIQMALFD